MADWAPIAELVSDVHGGRAKAADLVKKSLAAIKAHQGFDALISVTDERALQRANDVDAMSVEAKAKLPLAGVPFIAKDNFLTFGGQTTAASNMLKDFEAPYQATAIERLEAAGAICVAKANLDAWAHGASTENSDFFTTKNPHDKSRVPGGSSGGSAASVVLGIAPFAIGTDTGGSIRQPAGFSGCVGYKPTYGLVSRSGVVAMASSTDTIGSLARTVDDAALVLDVMSGRDDMDSTTIEADKAGYIMPEGSLKGTKIGVIKENMDEGVEPAVRQSVEAAIDQLKKAGAVVESVSLPSVKLALAVYYIVCPAEVSSNLARYDGQRYGHSSKGATNLQDSYTLSREEGFGAEAKRRIMIGSHVLSSGYYDAYYKKAQLVRTKIINEFAEAFRKYDLLAGPTSPTVAFKIGERAKNPLQMYLADIMTVAANVAGNPAISLPAKPAGKLPVGFHFIGDMKADRQLLGIAKAAEGVIQ